MKESEYRKGDLVLYVPFHAHGEKNQDKAEGAERGIVSSVNSSFVFVRFGDGETAKGCLPADLKLLVRLPHE